MTPNIDFPLYLNLSLYAILGIAALIGFARGFKKSLFSFITTLIFYVVFFLTVNTVVTFLWNVQISQLGQLFAMIEPSLGSATSFAQAAPLALEFFLGTEYAAITTNANFLELAAGLGIFALKLIYTILYFTIFFLIYKLLCLIIRSIILGGKRKTDKYVSKNRGFGLIFGLMEGCIALYVTLIVLGGMMSIADSLVNLAPTNETEEVVLAFPRDHLYEASYTLIAESALPAIPDEIMVMIEELRTFTEAYNNNLIVSLATQVTMPDDNDVQTPLNIYLFDEVLSFNYNDNQVSLRKELATFASIGAYVLEMEYMETSNISDITGDNVRDIFGLLSQSNLIVSILPLGIEMGAIYMEAPLTLPTEELYAINWAVELNQLGAIAATAFDIISQIGLLEDNPDYSQITIDGDTMRDLFDSLGDSQLITLAAYVAIEPLLRSAGETVQAVLTLPAGIEWVDIDWKEEFTGIGMILGAVLDTDITYEQITSGNYGIILNAVASIDFTVLLNSKLVCYSLVNILSGVAGLPGLDILVIPPGLVWLEYSEDGKTIIGGELKNILQAISAMTSIMGKIDFDNLSPSALSDLSDEAIDTIFESRVLVATLSSILLDIPLGEFKLIVPMNAVDSDFYILKDEMKNMVKAVKLLLVLPECEEGDDACETQEPDYLGNALKLSDEDIDVLLASNILSSTIGNLLNEMAGDPLIVPLSVLQSVELAFPIADRGTSVSVISKLEIKRILQAVLVFGITDFEGITFDASIIENLESQTLPGTIDEEKLTRIFASGVIHATISHMIIELMSSEDAFVTIPYFAQDGITEIRYSEDSIDYISTDELKAVLRALFAVGLTDFENIEASLNLNTILDNIDLLLDSSVLHATVSKQLLDMGGNPIIVPETYFDDFQVQIKVGDSLDNTETTYINRLELEAIFDGLALLEIDDITTVDFDASIISKLEMDDDPTQLDNSKLNTLFSSAIIHATLSNVLLDLMSGDSQFVVVPYFGLDDDNLEYEVLVDYDGIQYIATDELIAALKALHSLNITDFETIEETFNLQLILDNIEILLKSAILHATVSKQLLDMQGNPIIIPTKDLNDNSIQIMTGDPLESTDTTYIVRSELQSIFDSLDILGISDIEAVTFDATIINNLEDDEDATILSESKLNTLFASAIIHATISDMLYELMSGDDPFVVVPTYGIDDSNAPFEIKQSAYGIDYVSKTELENVLKALHALNITDFDTMETALTLDVILANIDILLNSAILHSTVSKQLLDMDGGNIIIPTKSLSNADVQVGVGDELAGTYTLYITRDELIAIFDALEILGISNIETVSFDASIINNLEDDTDSSILSDVKLNTLFASVIIHATISDMLYNLTTGDNPFVIVPAFGIDELNNPFPIKETAHSVDYVSKSELQNVLKAMHALNITDFDTIESTLTLDVIMDNIDILLASSILHATVSDQILTIEADMIVVPETYGLGINEKIIRIPVDTVIYIHSDELKAMFTSLQLLGFTDFSVSLDATIINRLEDDSDPSVLDQDKLDILFASAIIHASFSKMFFDLTDVEEGEEAMVVVPSKDYQLVTILYSEGSIDYISIAELQHTLSALHALDVTDFNAVNALDMDTIIANLSTILSSAIMHATISKQIIDMTDDNTLIVPYFASDNTTIIRKLVVDVEFISSDELGYLFDAMKLLGVTGDLSLFSGELDFSPFFVAADRTQILLSAIMHVMISDTLTGLDASTLTVPYFYETGSSANDRIRITVGEIGFTNEYVKKVEIHALFEALHVLGISGDIEEFDGNINLDALFDETQRDLILSSAIMQARISEEIFALGNEVLNVPYYHEDDVKEVRRTVGVDLEATEYILIVELVSIFESLPLLGFTGDIQGFNGEVNLSALFVESSRTTILSSATLHARISKELMDLGAETLAIPYTASDGMTAVRVTVGLVGFTTEYIYATELSFMFEALELLGFTGDIQNFDGNVELTSLFDEDTRPIVLSSAIVHAKISYELTHLGASTLAIPYTAANNISSVRITVGNIGYTTEYIVSEELGYLFEAMELLGFTGDVLGEGFTGEFDLTPLFDEVSRPLVLVSSIIHAKISEELVNLGATTLAIPYTAFNAINKVRETVGLFGYETEYIVEIELANLFEAMELLGFTGDILGEEFTGEFDLTPLFDDVSRPIVLSSSIIHAKISEELIGLGTITLDIPYAKEVFDEFDVDTYVRLTVGAALKQTEYIALDELGYLFEGLEMLGFSGDVLTDFDGDINISAFYVEEDRNVVLQSSILQAKISLEMFNLGSSTMLIPNQDVNGNVVRLLSGLMGMQTDYITKAELSNLFEALSVLGLSGDTNFGGTVELSNVATDEDQNTLLASATMHATITQQINDLGPEILVVPLTDVSEVTIKDTVGGTLFIFKNEIKALINALTILGVNDIALFDGAVTLDPFFPSINPNYDANQNTLLASAMMHATITKQINGLDADDVLLVPSHDFDNVAINSTVFGTYFIFKTEIKALINALDVLGVNDITDFTGGFTLANLATSDSQNTLLASASMHATVSFKLFDLNDDVLIVPIYSQLGEIEANRIQKQVSLTDYIFKDEIKALIDAFTAMGFLNLESFGSEIDSSKFFEDPDTILLSSSIQATLSKKMLEGTNGELIVPNTNFDTAEIIQIVQSDVTYIEIDEMKAILHALDLLGLTDFATMAFDPATIFAADFDELLASVSMQATISKNILSGALDQTAPVGSGNLIVPDYFRQTIDVGILTPEQIELVELKALLTALEALGITDFGGSMSGSTFTTLNDATLTTMLLSGSMHVTLDNMLKGNSNVNSPEKAYISEDSSTVTYGITGLLKGNEIKYFILAAKAIGGSDFTSVDFDYNSLLSMDASDRETVVISMIVRNMLTSDLATAVAAKNAVNFPGGPFYNLDAEDYEDDNVTLFLTYLDTLEILKFLNDEPFTD